jgi:tRNA pseudouridine13 synthase
LDIPRRDIGCAGLKDRHAITRQYISIPAKCEDRVSKINGEDIQVLHATRHNNKLKTGHQRGNKFIIRVRGVNIAQAPHLEAILARLKAQGLPNYYGEQRFGRDNQTLEMGLKQLQGEKLRLPPFLRKLSLSAVQSALFNAVLEHRIRDQLFRKVLPGDVMQKISGGLFVAEEVAVEQERFDRRETVHAGPIYGKKTFAAKAEAALREEKVLMESGLTIQSFEGFGNLLEGTRRANVIGMEELESSIDSEGLVLKFSLPSGSYATVLLREIMKTQVSLETTAMSEENTDGEGDS